MQIATVLIAWAIPAAAQATVLTGAAVLVERSGHLFEPPARPKVAMITNRSAVMPGGVPDVERLAKLPGLQIVEILTPEHGFDVDSQTLVGNSRDPLSGLPIYSLYGRTLAPTPQMLAGVDALVYDVQDVGARFYTYISTLYLAMEAARRAHKEFVVLDRPNPLGGVTLEGGVLDPRFRSFTGPFEIPVRYGMTAGELAQLFNTKIGCNLMVVP
ncbi:MAG: DUF1343 domain-containing protein, partial [Cyanobacteria bacterium REEB65]|nr:DUF1343 domain-containing protein [Cyanobacteria bacterium REEB65]